jgi:pimeloyl-ACP methyl ester carboxylesterase
LNGGTIRTPDGRTLAWAEYGDPGGVPVVFHHGTPGSRLNRHPDPSFYERHGVRLITYDRPGYGGSDARPGRTVADAAADTRALVDELGLERCAVAGGSGGGPHALACGALLPDRVTRVAVVVGVGPSDDPDLDFLDGMSPSNVEEFEAASRGRDALDSLLEPYVKAMAKDPLALFDEIEHELPEPDRATLRRDDVRAVVRESSREAMRQGSEGWVEDDLAFACAWGFNLGDVRVPVRLWQGELDVLVPRHHTQYLASKLPDAEFELLPDAGHLLFDELGAVYDWLAED